MVEAPKPKEPEKKPTEEEKKEEETVETVQVDILEEDDDFEEFKVDEYEDSAMIKDEKVEWEDDWDDEEDDDDYAKRLRAEVAAYEKRGRVTASS